MLLHVFFLFSRDSVESTEFKSMMICRSQISQATHALIPQTGEYRVKMDEALTGVKMLPAAYEVQGKEGGAGQGTLCPSFLARIRTEYPHPVTREPAQGNPTPPLQGPGQGTSCPTLIPQLRPGQDTPSPAMPPLHARITSTPPLPITYPWTGSGQETPCSVPTLWSGPGQGNPPPPNPQAGHATNNICATDSKPLAFQQEDFLVLLVFLFSRSKVCDTNIAIVTNL